MKTKWIILLVLAAMLASGVAYAAPLRDGYCSAEEEGYTYRHTNQMRHVRMWMGEKAESTAQRLRQTCRRQP